ncbi:MAG: N-acetylmuramoyl-L-alanine amidase [archaeon]
MRKTDLIKIGKCRILLAFAFIFFAAIISAAAYAATYSYSPSPLSYYSNSIDTYWPAFSQEQCLARQDFILQILPGSCSPAVVRSDLLEEQDVPVFCQLTGIKINPLIEVPEITSISFKGQQLSKDIAGIGFHPARAALTTWGTQLLGSPVLNNLGYLVVILKNQPIEKNMTEWVEANLTALIQYNAEKAFGVGKAGFLLPVLSEEEWKQYYKMYSFWNGKAYLRALEIGKDSAGEYVKIAIYTDAVTQLTSVTLRAGQSSNEIYLPGYYCSAALKVNLNSINYPEMKAKVRIGDDELWLSKGQRFLDDECWISNIEQNIVGGGKVTVNCKDSQPTTLSIDPPKARLTIRDSAKNEIASNEFKTGDKIVSGQNVYLAYIGSTSNAISSYLKNLNQDFVVIVKADTIKSDYFDNFNIVVNSLLKGKKYSLFNIFSTLIKGSSKFGEDIKCLSGCDTSVEKGLKDYLGKDAEFRIITASETGQGTFVWDYYFTFDKLTGSVEKNYNSDDFGKLLEEYFSESLADYKKVSEQYGSEKKSQQEGAKPEYYGADALYKAAELAGNLKKFKTQEDLLNRIAKDYSGSGIAEQASQQLELMKIHDLSLSSAFISASSGSYYAVLEDIKEVSRDEKSADLMVNGNTEAYSENEAVSGTLSVLSIAEDYVEFSYQNKAGNPITVKVKEKDSVKLSVKDASKEILVDLRVSKINLKKDASVTISPMIARAQTQANFTFKIGIEKRSIQLSTEKTQELISELNDSIAKWEKIVDNLGSIIKVWKGTCFAGSAYFVVKNFFNNLGAGSGSSLARTEAMKYWEPICQSGVAEGKYSTFHDCYYKNADAIDSSVSTIQGIYKNVNSKADTIKKTAGVVEKKEGVLGAFGEEYVNQEKYVQESQTYFDEYKDVTFKSRDGTELKAGDVFSEGNIKVLEDKNYLSSTDVRDSLFNLEMQQACTDKKLSDAMCQASQQKLYDDANYWNKILTTTKASTEATNIFQAAGIDVESTLVGDQSKAISFSDKNIVKEADYSKMQGVSISQGQKAAVFTAQGISYIAVLDSIGQGYSFSKIYEISSSSGALKIGDELAGENKRKILSSLGTSYAEITAASTYSNPYKNPAVKFWETGSYAGLPAILPLGKYAKDGWYAATEPSSLGTSSTKSYTESGMPVSYWICNVNGDGLEEWESTGHGDDKPCIQFSMQTGMSENTYSSIPNSADMIKLARQYLLEAARQYKNKGGISVGGQSFSRGKPAVTVPQYECEDFMSPKDCHTMFNLCDPVLCPSSRCDFGGKYPVADVVQTGIIGSIALCLPNAREGIIVPICLTGVHAGLDNFVMIQKAVRDCLQENLATGRNVGICDQIKSIYLCEFFWKQAAPLAKVGIPSLLETMSGKSTARGGGEYLFVQDSWQKAQDSVNYFTNYYGANAFNAFQARSTEAAGTEICKAWVSARYPTTSDMFDSLLEPESPVQFHATFSSNILSEATVPSTSHYKVYYRIYAGKDAGAYYNVYLKGSPQTEYYAQMQQMAVPNAVGYIAKGEQVDKSVDFTGPSGYTELCVKINAQEECGFGQVTTSYFMNELQDSYLAAQAAQQVKTEQECIAGTSGIVSVSSLNLQSSVESALSPSISSLGIIRVCTTDNPSLTTQPDRWKQVGYCTDKKIICWLDTLSLNQSFTDQGLLSETLAKAKELASTLQNTSMLDHSGSQALLAEVSQKQYELTKDNGILEKLIVGKSYTADKTAQEINSAIANVTGQYENIILKSLFNQDKAQARIGLAEIFDRITTLIFKAKIEKSLVSSEKKKSVEATEIKESSTEYTDLELNTEKILSFNSKEYPILLKELSVKDGAKISLGGREIILEMNIQQQFDLDESGDYLLMTLVVAKYRENVASIQLEKTSKKEVAEITKISPGTIKANCVSCSDGIFNTCSYSECHELGRCYIQKGLIKAACLNCEDGMECSNFNNQIECESNKCSVENCQWTGSKCIVSEEKKNLVEGSENTETPDNVVCIDIDADNSGITGAAVSNSEICIIIRKDYSASDMLNSKSESTFQSRQAIYILIDKYAKQYDVNFNLARAFIEVESSWDVKEQSSTGAYGLMQLKDTVVNDFKNGGACAKTMGILSINKYNTEQNIQGGIAYLACNMRRFSNIGLAIAAYKEGPTYVSTYCSKDISSCKNPFLKQNGDSAKAYVKKIGKAYYYIASSSQQANAAAAAAAAQSASKKIVIDAGHGGTDPGAVNSDGVNEKDMNLAIAEKLKSVLEEKGYSVKMTRETDAAVSLASRVKIANDFEADIFVSIHMNSASLDVDGKYCSANGAETFYYRTSTKGKEFARIVQENIVASLGVKDRGIKPDTEAAEGSLYVLKNTNMPAVLTEPAFICNKDDMEKISQESEKIQLASAISQSISAFA